MTATPPDDRAAVSTAPRLPLLPAQRGMLAGHLADPGSSAWSVALLTELAGPVDVDALATAIEATTLEMDALRLRLESTEDQPSQHVAPHLRGVVTVVDLTHGADGRSARQVVADLIDRPWRTGVDEPLATHTLIVTPTGVSWLQRGLHAVIDGYGGWLVRNRVVQHYLHAVNATDLPDEQFPSMHEVTQLDTTAPGGPEHYRHYLQGAPTRLSPAETSQPVSDHPHRHDVRLEDSVRVALAASLGNRVWTYPLIAAAGAYCARISEEAEAVIGLPVLGRTSRQERATPVQMMTVLPLRVAVRAGETLETLTARVVADAKAARPYAKVQAPDIFQAIPGAWKAGRVHGPVVNVMPFDEEPVIPGVTVATTALQRGPVYDILFTIHPGPDGVFLVEGLAHRGLYSAEETRWMTERLVAFLERASRPGAIVAEVDHRLPPEILSGEALSTPRVVLLPPQPTPAWGETVTLERLHLDGIPDEVPRGFEVRDRLGRPCGWHQVGELVAVVADQPRPTGLLVSPEPDGSLTCRGTVDERRQVRGRHVEAGAVGAAASAIPEVLVADVRWEDDRLVAEVLTTAGADTHALGEQVRRCAPAGCRLRVTVRAQG